MSLSGTCRFCDYGLAKTFINLGISPLSNAYLTQDDLQKKETFYPLHAQICEACFLVQLPQMETPENIFSDYAYFSSYSESWLQHSAAYTEMMINRFSMDATWQVIEIASNDGYLLQYFKAKHIPVLGIEPAANVAEVAIKKGIPTKSVFFGKTTAEKLRQEGKLANLLIANNVLAHVPDLNDFVAGLKIVLAPEGVLTIEFPHLLRLIVENQFDTIYHEHFSYFSCLTVQQVFAKHGLTLFDVEKVPVHGGSLRIFVKHTEDHSKAISPRVAELLNEEKQFGLDNIKTYQQFSIHINRLKFELLQFMVNAVTTGKTIVGYGAPAKGNTLLNYCGIGVDYLPFTVDKNPYKQNRYLPGTRIPIFHPEKIKEIKPDYLLLLPWNLKNEIMEQMAYIKEWGGKFIVPIPNLQVI